MTTRTPRRDLQDAALQRARRLVAEGARVCECAPRSPLMLADGVGLLRCVTCHGLEAAQADRAVAA